ncbi:uncharacterized protein C9orf40 [Parambassis ranga]|uniref:Uncharacterized protein C9orf40 n=1 Tax=Parambassis ranga TaxID=210632 RepID=A0A6P7J268_9TELE|nr:uncharacterized protein C9orf40 homolog [Parambassis ranga]
MAKRRAEDTLLHDSPSKRCFRPLCGVDMQLESVVPTVGLNPPSLLALLGNRCQKRKHYFEDQEKLEQAASVYRRSTHCDSRKHAAKGLTSGSFQDRRSSSTDTSTKKVPREHCTGSETVPPKTANKAAKDSNTEDAEDDTYNSFQYWRVPLPELDLSLLEDASDQSVAMET